MPKVLCTFSGKFGDILSSLPTVRQVSRNVNQSVYFGIMPGYKSLLPLLNSQSYIQHAFTIDEWICQGSPYGDQPAIPQNHETLKWQYDEIHHLTYRHHPAPNQPLIDFIASSEGITLKNPVVPFIDTGAKWWMFAETEADKILASMEIRLTDYVAFSFNEMYAELKKRFYDSLVPRMNGTLMVKTDNLSWKVAAVVIANATAFVGCRSSQHVLAHGVGQKNIMIYEPHPHRHNQGMFGSTFTNPYGREITGPLVTTPELEAERAAHFIGIWKKEKENYEINQTIPR